MCSIVNQIFIRFISDYDQIAILCKRRYSFCFFRCEDDACRVLWSVVVDSLRVFSCVTRERFLKTFGTGFERRHENAADLAVSYESFDRSSIRREENNLDTWIHNRLKSAKQSLHTAVHDDDIAIVGRNLIFAAEFFGDSGPEFRDAG